MNINKLINKLLYALSIKGQKYKINTFQFYSDTLKKYCTKYQVLKEEVIDIYNPETKRNETITQYNNDYETYKKVDLLKYLVEENKKCGDENV